MSKRLRDEEVGGSNPLIPIRLFSLPYQIVASGVFEGRFRLGAGPFWISSTRCAKAGVGEGGARCCNANGKACPGQPNGSAGIDTFRASSRSGATLGTADVERNRARALEWKEAHAAAARVCHIANGSSSILGLRSRISPRNLEALPGLTTGTPPRWEYRADIVWMPSP